MFVNHFSNSNTSSAFNLKSARFIVGVYSLWKLLSVNWLGLVSLPLAPPGFYNFFYSQGLSEAFVLVELILCSLLLLLFSTNKLVKLTGLVSSLILAHLSAILQSFTFHSGSYTFLRLVFSLIFLGLYNDRDLQLASQNYDLRPLKWLIVFLGLYYLSAGLGKLFHFKTTEWASLQNFEKITHFSNYITGSEKASTLIKSNGIAVKLGMIAVLVLQFVFLIGILLGYSLSIFFISLSLMHLLVFFLFGINFLENLILFSVFLPWDDVKSHLSKILERLSVF